MLILRNRDSNGEDTVLSLVKVMCYDGQPWVWDVWTKMTEKERMAQQGISQRVTARVQNITLRGGITYKVCLGREAQNKLKIELQSGILNPTCHFRKCRLNPIICFLSSRLLDFLRMII